MFLGKKSSTPDPPNMMMSITPEPIIIDPSILDILETAAQLALYKKYANLSLGVIIMVVNFFAAIFYVVVNLKKKKIVNYILLNQVRKSSTISFLTR